MRALVIVWLLVVTAASAMAEPLPRAVLILDESDPSGGAPTTFSATLRTTLSNVTPNVAVFGETVDLSQFEDPWQQGILRTYVQQKYNDVRFGVVVAVGASALDLERRWRSELWPDATVVFAAIDEMTAAELKPDSKMTGLIMRRTIRSMLTIARILVPDLQGVAVLGGSLEKDAYRLQYLRELPALAAETNLTDLTGLPLRVQAARAAALPDKTAIFYTSLFIDNEGTRYSSRDALITIAKVANRPIVIDVESLVGSGATGGYVLNNVAYGQEVAALVTRLLDGANVAENPATVSEFTKPIFDWRQLQRWHIAESALPAGSEIRFRQPGMWEQYRAQILMACAAFLAQTALVGWLIYEHRRRRIAEAESLGQVTELARMNRFATAGELSASIAHEIRQPLSAISVSGQAGLSWLKRQVPNLDEIRSSLEAIVEQSHRADDVIKSVRAMFKHESRAQTEVNLNELIRQVTTVAAGPIKSNNILLETNLTDDILPLVMADPIQLQQVILNLVMNAVEAMSESQHNVRILKLQSEARPAGTVLLRVVDSGPRIDPAVVKKMFQPFFTTKSNGMGMGLSICKTIIEAHGGRLTASPTNPHGMEFLITLPLHRHEINAQA
jgi:signal transduction histidine kinase